MTVRQLEQRVVALEREVERLNRERAQTPAPAPAAPSEPWWRKTSGVFANDPVFDEIVRLGREYRESLRPGYKRKTKKKAGKKRDRS